MKTSFALGLIAWVWLLSFPFPALRAAEFSQSEKPVLVIKEDVFDAKSMVEGEEIVHTFTILNQGTAPLTIYKIKPG